MKDIKRFTVVCDEQHQDALAVLAKRYKITQGEVIEVMLDHMNEEDFAAHFEARRNEKVAARKSKSALMERLSGLSAEQVQKLLSSATA